jgi:hypothetical protein
MEERAMRTPGKIGTAILTLVLALGLALPAAADGLGRDNGDQEKAVPVVFDVLLLRPIGLMMTVAGTVFYAVPVAPLTLMTRPSDIAKPFKLLVGAPARFTFVDPLGQH